MSEKESLMKQFFAVFFISAALAACANVDDVLSSWHGRHSTALTRHWGPPTETWAQKDGGKLLVYRFKRDDIQKTFGDINKSLLQINCIVNFRTDRAGTIVSSSDEASIGGCGHLLSAQRAAPPPR